MTGVTMFEKEAEEYADKDFGMYEPTDHERYAKETDWRNGAEFGYNKAKEEMQEQGLALQSDMDKTIEQNIALKKELNKANEWHFVKDGDLPKEIKEYLVYKIDGYGCKSIQVKQFNNQHCWCANCQNEIKAWKEIVLPKEIKEND